MSTTVHYEIEAEDGFVLLLVTRRSGHGSNSHSEGIRIPFDQIKEAIQALTDAARDAERASSAAETEKRPCRMVFDGNDTDGDVWNRCVVHDMLVFGDALYCEGYRAPLYVEKGVDTV